eukprot:116182_1
MAIFMLYLLYIEFILGAVVIQTPATQITVAIIFIPNIQPVDNIVSTNKAVHTHKFASNQESVHRILQLNNHRACDLYSSEWKVSHYLHPINLCLVCLLFMAVTSRRCWNIYNISLTCIKLITIYTNRIVFNIHVSFYKYILSTIAIYTFIQPICSEQTNQYEHDTGPNGTDIWRSTSNFIPVQQTSYGNITIGSIMSTEFDFIWWGRTADQRIGYPENFFRVGFDAQINTQCTGETASYP